MCKKTIIVVAAHPDDEALGCGGTIARFRAQGAHVVVLFLTDGVGARNAGDDKATERQDASQKALQCLGVDKAIYLDFLDNRMDNHDLLDIVQGIETELEKYSPDLVLTHQPFDLNKDHRIVHQAVMTALRPQPERLRPTILCFEVQSSSEWQMPVQSMTFTPNWFINITDHLEAKMKALTCYDVEMRSFPHSRSKKAIESLARWRGASVGHEAAEAFMLARHIVD